jgi:integrase
MTTLHKPKHRRARGSGSVFKVGRVYWISYWDAAGKRVKESSGSQKKANAERLLGSRNGSVAHHLPIVRNAEKATFNEAAKAVVNDCTINGKTSLAVVQRRIEKHLAPVFGGRRLASITTTDVIGYIAHRQKQGIIAHRGPRAGERVADVSNGEVNRELQTLKRIFNLAIEQDRIAMKPKIRMLAESDPRSGFFEPEQLASVLAHLPADIQPVIRFAYITGWRIASEVLPLEWRQIDFAADEVRLEPGMGKTGKGRTFPFTDELRAILEAQHLEHVRLKKSGAIVPQVFFRMVAKGRGGEKSPRPITSFNKAWKFACRAAGCPGRIPHDLRRTAIRNFVRNGISQTVAMRLGGHKTDSVFRRYDIVADQDLRDAAIKLNRVGKAQGESNSLANRNP